MTPQDLTNFRNEQNRSETELEFLAFLLYGLRQAQGENNETTARIAGTLIENGDKTASQSQKAEEQREVHTSLLSYILDEIRKKDIDLSSVIAGLEAVRMEVAASRQEVKDNEPQDEVRNQRILGTLGKLIEETKKNKPIETDLSPVVEKTDETGKRTHELLSSLIEEIAKIDVRPEVKVDIPDTVEVKEPKWYKPFSWEKKWLEPIEKAIDAINPKKGLEKLEKLGQKILDKPLPKVPLNKDGNRVLVEVDRTGGGGSGVIDSLGNPVNPATEEKQDPTARYQLANYDVSASPIYIGKVDSDGAWMIKQIDTSTGIALYFKGDTDYATGWSGRAGLSYDSFDNIF